MKYWESHEMEREVKEEKSIWDDDVERGSVGLNKIEIGRMICNLCEVEDEDDEEEEGEGKEKERVKKKRGNVEGGMFGSWTRV